MPENISEPCENCGYEPFPRYATICPACREARWDRWYEYIPPDPKTGKFHDSLRVPSKITADGAAVKGCQFHEVPNRERVPAAHLTVTPADRLAPDVRAKHWPKGKGLVLLVRGTGPGGSWESIEKPCGDNLVKPIGYVWSHTSRHEDHTDGEFPPLGPDEARDKFFYEEARKPKKEKLADTDILARARRLHPEWDCDFSMQYMRQLRDAYAVKHGLPEIKKRPYSRK